MVGGGGGRGGEGEEDRKDIQSKVKVSDALT